MTTPPRQMRKDYANGHPAYVHPEMAACATYGCVPADAPGLESPSVLMDLLVRRIPGVPDASSTPADQRLPASLDVPTMRLSVSAAVGCPRVLPADVSGPATPGPRALLPCPFCGYAGQHGDVENPWHYVATQCLSCGARGPLSAMEGTYPARVDEAATQWNTRTPLTLDEARCRAFQLLTETEAALHAERLQECHVSLQEEPHIPPPSQMREVSPWGDRVRPHEESATCAAYRCVPVDAPLPDEAPQVLLPCPGCGAPAYLRSFRGIRCSADPCGWEVTGWTEADMVTQWNTRMPLPEVQRLREAAQAVVEAVVEAWATEYRFHADDGCPICTAIQALEAVLREGEAP